MRPYLYLKVGLIFSHFPLPELYGPYIPLQKYKKAEHMLVISLKMAEAKSIQTTGHLGALQGFFQASQVILCVINSSTFFPLNVRRRGL